MNERSNLYSFRALEETKRSEVLEQNEIYMYGTIATSKKCKGVIPNGLGEREPRN